MRVRGRRRGGARRCPSRRSPWPRSRAAAHRSRRQADAPRRERSTPGSRGGLATGEGYSYDPVYHGPVQFYLIALARLPPRRRRLRHARIPPALMGTIAVFLPFFLRRQLGTVGGADRVRALLCLAPSYLYFSRFAREDIYVACITLALIVVLLRFFDEPRRWHPAALLGLLAVSFATKETTYITVFVVGLFCVARRGRRACGPRRGGPPLRDDAARRRRAVARRGGVGVGRSARSSSSYTLLFSTFLTNPAGLQEGLWGSIDYWLSQQDVEPRRAAVVLLPRPDPGVRVADRHARARRHRRRSLRRPTLQGAFLVWCSSAASPSSPGRRSGCRGSCSTRSCRSSCSPAIGAQALWAARRRLPARVALGVGGARGGRGVWSRVGAAVLLPRGGPAGAARAGAVVRRRARHPGRASIALQPAAYAGGTASRSCSRSTAGAAPGGRGAGTCGTSRVGYYDMSVPERGAPRARSCSSPIRTTTAMRPRLRRLRGRAVPAARVVGARVGRRRARAAGCAGLTRREAWSPTATMDEWLYVRRDFARLTEPP